MSFPRIFLFSRTNFRIFFCKLVRKHKLNCFKFVVIESFSGVFHSECLPHVFDFMYFFRSVQFDSMKMLIVDVVNFKHSNSKPILFTQEPNVCVKKCIEFKELLKFHSGKNVFRLNEGIKSSTDVHLFFVVVFHYSYFVRVYHSRRHYGMSNKMRWIFHQNGWNFDFNEFFPCALRKCLSWNYFDAYIDSTWRMHQYIGSRLAFTLCSCSTFVRFNPQIAFRIYIRTNCT